jgi:hydroxypyruvate reductase
VLDRWRVTPPPRVAARLRAGRDGLLPETPKPGDPVFARVENRIVASARPSLAAGAEIFRARGIPPLILGHDLDGEAGAVGRALAATARSHRPPVALISGGECTVALPGPSGRGGRCAELLLAFAIAAEGAADVWALAADTDGIDGTEANAGALVTPDTLSRARAAGVDAEAALARHDSHGFFSELGDLVTTGPTRTNVNEYRAVVRF